MLAVTNLSFGYKDQQILDHLDFEIASGEIVGLVAPNGTGKSTLLQNLTGLLTPKSGTITLNGHDARHDRTAFLQDMFFLADNQCLYAHLTAIEQITYIQQMWRSTIDPEYIIHLLDMAAYRKKRISKMSLGMRQHVLLACYLASNAPMMFFDEPLNGLDPTSIQRFTQIFMQLRDHGHSIIMSSHSVENVATMADRTFFLTHGHLQICQTASIDLLQTYNDLFEVKPLADQFQV